LTAGLPAVTATAMIHVHQEIKIERRLPMQQEHEQSYFESGKHEKPFKIFHVLIDHKPHDWTKPIITGAEIKQLAGVDSQTFEAWQDVSGPEDKFIGDTYEVDLAENGTEKFFTIKKTTTEG
jgi:hypothetical protein